MVVIFRDSFTNEVGRILCFVYIVRKQNICIQITMGLKSKMPPNKLNINKSEEII